MSHTVFIDGGAGTTGLKCRTARGAERVFADRAGRGTPQGRCGAARALNDADL
ncbi:MAG: hypothetical protein R3D89_03870 [Sphingomonadaceae bacterium]